MYILFPKISPSPSIENFDDVPWILDDYTTEYLLNKANSSNQTLNVRLFIMHIRNFLNLQHIPNLLRFIDFFKFSFSPTSNSFSNIFPSHQTMNTILRKIKDDSIPMKWLYDTGPNPPIGKIIPTE
jgi:hypothetical protein